MANLTKGFGFNVATTDSDTNTNLGNANLTADNSERTYKVASSGAVAFQTNAGENTIKLNDNGNIIIGASDNDYTMPNDRGSEGQILKASDGSGTIEWATDTNTFILSESLRFSTNNLATDEGLYYTYQGEQTTKGGLINAEVDPTAFDSPTSLRAMIYIRPTSGTYNLHQVQSIMSGTTSELTLSLWKAAPCGQEDPVAGTLIGSGGHSLEGNAMNVCANWSLGDAAAVELDSAEVLIMTLHTEEPVADLDCRGQVTFEINKRT